MDECWPVKLERMSQAEHGASKESGADGESIFQGLQQLREEEFVLKASVIVRD